MHEGRSWELLHLHNCTHQIHANSRQKLFNNVCHRRCRSHPPQGCPRAPHRPHHLLQGNYRWRCKRGGGACGASRYVVVFFPPLCHRLCLRDPRQWRGLTRKWLRSLADSGTRANLGNLEWKTGICSSSSNDADLSVGARSLASLPCDRRNRQRPHIRETTIQYFAWLGSFTVR